MNHSKLLIAFLVLTFNFSAYAQENDVEVIVLDVDASDVKHQARIPEKNYVYFNTYLLARGAFVLGYERMLTPFHALDVSFGPTYRDFIYEGFNDEDDFDISEANVTPGTFISANYKLFPAKNLHYDNKFYISPGFIRRVYNVEVPVMYSGTSGNVEEDVDSGYGITDMSLKIGYFYDSWWFDGDIVVDAYVGFGLRTINRNRHEIETVSGSTNQLKTFVEKKKTSAVYLGIKIGFVF